MLNEKLGVPEGINKQALEIYNSLIEDLKKFDNGKPLDLSDFYKEKFVYSLGSYDVKISDLKMESVPFKLILHEREHPKNPILFSASYGSNVSFGKDPELNYNVKTSHFLINVSVDDKTTKSQIVDVIERDLKPNIIAHELMHFYDKSKLPKDTIEKRAEYVSYQKGGFPPMINDFLHLLYYMTGIENVVRPSELQQMISDNMITKSEFKDFVNSTEMMKNIKRAEKFSLEEFKNELENDKEVIRMVKTSISKGYNSIGSVSDDALNLIVINVSHGALDATKRLLKDYLFSFTRKMNPLESLLRSSELTKREERANKEFNRILKKYQKYESNPQKYFELLEKNLNFTGNKLKIKLFKLFDMAKEDKKDNSIINWDLHTKITQKSEGLVYTLDFESFKSKFK
jgi:hypothetical protein